MAEPEGDADNDGGPSEAAHLADSLNDASDLLVAQFGKALAGSTTVFATSIEAREQAQAQMRLIINDVVHGLRGQFARRVGDMEGIELSQEIGLDRAREHIHPLDSLTAARQVSRIVLNWAVRQIPHDGGPSEALLGTLLSELGASLVFRITEATTWYASYLLNQVVHAQRDERRRVARDLHDQVGYGVVEAKLGLEASRALPGPAVEAAEEVIERTIDRLDATSTMINKLIGDLRAEVADLSLALKGLARESSSPAVTVTFEVNGEESWLSATVRTEAFLIVRESVRNALRHSGARTIRVVVSIMPFIFTANVDDDGLGRPASARPLGPDGTAGESGGHGVIGMAERAALLGGNLSVSERHGGGTRVSLRVPLSLDPFVEVAEIA